MKLNENIALLIMRKHTTYEDKETKWDHERLSVYMTLFCCQTVYSSFARELMGMCMLCFQEFDDESKPFRVHAVRFSERTELGGEGREATAH